MTTRQFRVASGGSLRILEWVLGIAGGIAAFLGLFILLGGDDQSIGIGGDLSWRVGDIAAAWGVALLAGGGVAGLATLLLVWRGRRGRAAGAGPRSAHADWYVHAVVFVIVNIFIWVQDAVSGGGVDYAFWVTIPWGIGLTVHAIAEFAGQRGRPVPR